jgi:hypothetical protein
MGRIPRCGGAAVRRCGGRKMAGPPARRHGPRRSHSLHLPPLGYGSFTPGTCLKASGIEVVTSSTRSQIRSRALEPITRSSDRLRSLLHDDAGREARRSDGALASYTSRHPRARKTPVLPRFRRVPSDVGVGSTVPHGRLESHHPGAFVEDRAGAAPDQPRSAFLDGFLPNPTPPSTPATSS